METLSYGFLKPEDGDTGDVIFPALASDIQKLNDHNHDGINSPAISTTFPPAIAYNLLKMMSTALNSPVTMTVNAGNPALFDIPSFTATFVDHTNPLAPVQTQYTYPGSTGNAITNLATAGATYISVSSAGAILQTVDIPSSAQLKTHVCVGNLLHASGTMIDNIYTASITPLNGIQSALTDLAVSIGVINVSGNVVSGNGANLKVNKSAGKTYSIGINIADPTSPNIISDAATNAAPFFSLWRDGSGNWTIIQTDTIVPDKYDNNLAGGVTAPVTTLTSNKWQLFRVYQVEVINTLAFEFGQVAYNSSDEALASISAAVTQSPATVPLKFRGWFVVRGGATSLTSSSDAIFLDAGKFGQGSASAGGGGGSTTTLQGAYDNSLTPEILTDSSRGALTVQRGSAADTDAIFEGKNGAGTTKFSVSGAGIVTATSFNDTSVVGTFAAPQVVTTQIDLSSFSASKNILVFVEGNTVGNVSINLNNITGLAGFAGQTVEIFGVNDAKTVSITDGHNGPITFGNKKIASYLHNGVELTEKSRN